MFEVKDADNLMKKYAKNMGKDLKSLKLLSNSELRKRYFHSDFIKNLNEKGWLFVLAKIYYFVSKNGELFICEYTQDNEKYHKIVINQ